MDQQLALEILYDGQNVLLTGPAGSGKTYVLNQFIAGSRRSGKHVSVTATTGLAATHLGGTTIHSWAGIGVSDELKADFEDYLLKGRRSIIETTDILIIDEISMLHDFRLDMIDTVCRTVREDDRPFGGIQVVLCGDFFQLPPVNRSDNREGGFITTSQVWNELDFVVCYLEEQHRQDDSKFLEILNALRANDLRRSHVEMLMDRVDGVVDTDKITELHTVNIDVDTINHARLNQLEGETHYYEMSTTGSENYVMRLKQSCMAVERLALKLGSLVMAIKNSTEKKYVNGSIGTVIGFEPGSDYPIVEFLNGRTITMQHDSWELRDGDKKRAGISQIPLRLAWAITVHKSQGMTLDSARIDLRKAFVEGMGYVALSRVRSLDTLSLVGINRMALRVSDMALEIDDTLRQRSALAVQKFEHLRNNETLRNKTKKIKEKNASTWKERLDKMRQKHPNAYRPWTSDQDDLLKLDFQNGVDVKALSKKLGRHERSVIMRLQKHFGDDIIAT